MSEPLAPVVSAARTISGSQVIPGLADFDRLRIQLNVTAASGTTPTLDVVVEDTVDGTNFNTIGTFAQKVTTGREVISVVGLIGARVRVRWTIAGTTPSFTFDIAGAAERSAG